MSSELFVVAIAVVLGLAIVAVRRLRLQREITRAWAASVPHDEPSETQARPAREPRLLR